MTNNHEIIKNDIKKFLENDPFYSELIKSELTPSLNLLDSGILDSFGILNLIVFLEKKYGFSIQIEELNEKNFHNIDRIAEFILSRGALL